MKVALPCSDCFSDLVPAQGCWSGQVLEHLDSFIIQNYNDEGIYRFTCKNGHDSVVIHQDQKFEMLFDIGAWAICDGYYREAVMSFAASLERFYEFYMRAVVRDRGIALDVFDGSWSQVCRQSERQYGAFVFVYLMAHGHAPEKPNDKIASLRNQVAHNGTIPSEEEAIKYGQLILDRIRPLLKVLKSDFVDGIRILTGEQIGMKHRGLDGSERVSTLGGSTKVLSVVGRSSDDTEPDMESVLKMIACARESIRQLEVEMSMSTS